jgi:hypothetical protein
MRYPNLADKSPLMVSPESRRRTTTGAEALSLVAPDAALEGPLFHGRAGGGRERIAQTISYVNPGSPPQARALTWKSGASAPRKDPEKIGALAPEGRPFLFLEVHVLNIFDGMSEEALA